MTLFGPGWDGHPEIFFSRWRETVRDEDIVIIAGDISWALKFGDALPDLQMIADLPGTKILLRGNHDYWWPSISKLRAVLPAKMYAIQNDSLIFGKTAICGSRGWECPGSEGFSSEDARLFEREVTRLNLALSSLKNKSFDRLVIALHYPPTNARFEANALTELIEQAKPDAVIYGHLHNVHPGRILRNWKGIPLYCVALDAVAARPQVIFEDA